MQRVSNPSKAKYIKILTKRNRFMKLGLQGHSIFYASGDDGVAGPDGDDNDNGCLGPDSKIFSPAWPNRYEKNPMVCLESAD